MSQIDHEMIQVTALKMVFDILLLHDTDLFRTDKKDVTATDDDDDDVQEEDGDVMADVTFSDEAVDKRQDGDEATHKLLKMLIDVLDHEVLCCKMMMLHNH